MTNLDVAEILRVGLSGLIFLLAYLTYRLLRAEQKRNRPRKMILGTIGGFMALCVLMAVLGLISEAIQEPQPVVSLPEIPPDVNWEVYGSFVPPDGVDDTIWSDGRLIIVPTSVKTEVGTEGRFTIQLSIERGKAFEDVISLIRYEHPQFTAQINIAEEHQKYADGDEATESLLLDKTALTRSFAPVTGFAW